MINVKKVYCKVTPPLTRQENKNNFLAGNFRVRTVGEDKSLN